MPFSSNWATGAKNGRDLLAVMIGNLLVRCKNLLVRWLAAKTPIKSAPVPPVRTPFISGLRLKSTQNRWRNIRWNCTSIFISWIHAKLFVVIFNKSVETNLLQYKFILHSVKKCQKVQIEDWGKDISCPLRPFRPLWCPWFSCGLAELADWELILDNLLRLHCD